MARMNLGVDMVAAVIGPRVKIAKPMCSQSSSSVMSQTLALGDLNRVRRAWALPPGDVFPRPRRFQGASKDASMSFANVGF
ncbi:hypothetical protein GCM10017600_50170 [Streptosporangium carneum]|uniref:Uncharacterized protein n=1 Tax=Streptosporangium carneum TaxID=47481 RepID=A0A9W6I3X2_9ACTN|nr:hypothetical protein GCM10017600_50170 [Streptosporangium carneum]